MSALTPKQRAFCREYIDDENRRQAAIRAGYRPKSASERGGKLLQDPRIQDLISKLRAAQVPPDDMTLEGHWRALAQLRDRLEAAGDRPDITAPQVSALRGAVDAEVARGRALKLLNPDPRDPEQPSSFKPKHNETMGEVLRGTGGNGSRKAGSGLG